MKDDVREPVCGVAGTVRRDRFTGPLGLLEAGIRAALAEEGFTPGSIRCVTDTMRRLSCWMEQHDVTPGGLTADAVGEFVAAGSDLRTARRGLGALLRLLRGQAVIPPERDSGEAIPRPGCCWPGTVTTCPGSAGWPRSRSAAISSRAASS